MKSFIKKLLGFSVGPIIGSFISLLTVPITTYFIIPAEYGKASMFTMTYSLVKIIVYLGYDQSFVTYYHESRNKEKLFANSIIIPFLFSVLLALCTCIFAPNISKILFNDDEYILPIYILALSIPFIVFERFILLQLRMQERALSYSFFNVILKIIIFLITLFFILTLRRDFLAIVYSSIIGQIAGDILLILKYKKLIMIKKYHLDKNQIKSLSKFGFPLLIVTLVGWSLNSMDRVFLRLFSNYDEIGFYTAAMKLANMLLIIQSSFSSFWIPTAYRWHNEGVNYERFEKISKSLCIAMSFLFMTILLFKNLITFVLSEKYINSIPIFPFLLFHPIMYTLSETTTLGIPFSKKSYLNLVVSILTFTTNFGLNFLLVPRFGAIGASFATGCSYITFFWIRTLISRRLWYSFDIKHYMLLTINIFIVALFNTIYPFEFITYIITLIGMLSILYIYRDICRYLYEKVILLKNERQVKSLGVIVKKIKR